VTPSSSNSEKKKPEIARASFDSKMTCITHITTTFYQRPVVPKKGTTTEAQAEGNLLRNPPVRR